MSGRVAVPAELVFVAAFFVVALAPLVFLPLARGDVSVEKRELAPEPALVVEGRPNLDVLQEAGAWFEDHFAFRGALVDLDATLKERIFMTSPVDTVVVGSDGWLYYAGTLNDWQRRNAMSEHALMNAARNISLIQEWVLGQGKGFALAIAPNKNTLYPQHMPYYEVSGEGQSNMERLVPLLAREGVRYVDLHSAIEAQGGVLYYARDSHWNSEGALVAYRAIADALPTDLADFAGDGPEETSHVGDVDQMLHPQTASAERDVHWGASDAWEMTNDAAGVEDNTIETSSIAENPADASLVMYRDSFGNNLLPYFAAAYKSAVFSKLVPYDMGPSAIRGATDVVIERAERHIDLFATDPPYMPSPMRRLGEATVFADDADADGATIALSANGPYLVVEGTVSDGMTKEDAPIYVELTFGDDKVQAVEAFRVSQASAGVADTEGADESGPDSEPVIAGDWGYRAYFYVGQPDLSSVRHIRVMSGDHSAPMLLAER